eukprot:12882464-Prorocentrum_lima.AAC.1
MEWNQWYKGMGEWTPATPQGGYTGSKTRSQIRGRGIWNQSAPEWQTKDLQAHVQHRLSQPSMPEKGGQ